MLPINYTVMKRKNSKAPSGKAAGLAGRFKAWSMGFPVLEGKSAVLMSVLALVLALVGWVGGPNGAGLGHGWSRSAMEQIWVEVQADGKPKLLLAYSRAPQLSEVLVDADLKAWPGLADRVLTTSALVTVNSDGNMVWISPMSGTTALALGQPLNMNRATVADLQLLPGVGPATARRLVKERTEGGLYSSAQDLTRVKGIGPATAHKLKPLVAFD